MKSEEKPEVTKAIVNIGDDGDMIPGNPEGALKIANMHLRSGMLPKHYNTIEKVVTASTWARELGLKPLSALRQIAVINGNPSLYGDLPLSLVTVSPDFEYIREYFVDENYDEICVKNKNLKAKAYAAVCCTKRKNNPNEHETFFTMDDKSLAGLSGNTWNKYTKDMLLYRARARNLKSSFPECLNGAGIAEYDNSVMPEVEGIVINSVNHSGERSRIEKVKEQFVDAPLKEEVANEGEAIPQVDKPKPNKRRHGGGAKKKGSEPEQEIETIQVASKEPITENTEMFDMRLTD